MTSMSVNGTSVAAADTTKEVRQPRWLEKKKNIAVQCVRTGPSPRSEEGGKAWPREVRRY
jgi:hypothetical protein